MPECEEFKKFQAWYEEEVMPKLGQVASHVVTCEKCQRAILEAKDSLALKILQMPSDETLSILAKFAHSYGQENE